MIEIPLTQLMEDNLCDRYLTEIGQHDSLTDRTICKADKIQSRLAYLNASFGVIESATGLITAFPYGVLADNIGRKPVLYLSATGTALYLAYDLAILKFANLLSIEYILLGPLFTLIGGGSTVINASLYSLASDLVPDTNMYAAGTFQCVFELTDIRDFRAISSSMMAFGTLFGSSVGPIISSKLIETSSPWLPMLLGSLTVPASMSLLIFLPDIETQRNKSSKRDLSELGDTFPGTIKSQVSQSWAGLRMSMQGSHSISIALILITFLRVMPEALAYGQLLVQYVSKRFGWTFANVGYLLTARGITQMLILFFLFPLLSKLLSNHMRSAVKDLILGRLSACLVIFGSLVTGAPHIGLAIFGLVLQASGAGLGVICRALAMSYIEPEDVSKINAMIGIFETLGSLFAGPTLAWLFAMGLKLKGIWFGLPYFGLAAGSLICLLGLFLIKPDHDQEFRVIEIDENQPSTGSDSD
ncbi:hypothetical protein N7528_008443 [Penicillium herquei]|nr:hypothetical protein N7528_008443 [Penicillium herquei]